MKNEDITSREGLSFWVDRHPATDFPTLKRGLKVDVAILGGGIAGVTVEVRSAIHSDMNFMRFLLRTISHV